MLYAFLTLEREHFCLGRRATDINGETEERSNGGIFSSLAFFTVIIRWWWFFSAVVLDSLHNLHPWNDENQPFCISSSSWRNQPLCISSSRFFFYIFLSSFFWGGGQRPCFNTASLKIYFREQGKGTADRMMPFGDWLHFFFKRKNQSSISSCQKRTVDVVLPNRPMRREAESLA